MPPPRTHGFRSILCAVDFSPQSAKALRYAAALARACGGRVTARLRGGSPAHRGSRRRVRQSPAGRQRPLTDLERFVRASVRGAAAADIRSVVRVGPAGAVVSEYARHMRGVVVVMGTHGRRGAAKLFFGSTTEAVLRHVRRPVLAIPPHCREPRAGWPGGSIVAAIDEGAHRRATVSTAAQDGRSVRRLAVAGPRGAGHGAPAARPR